MADLADLNESAPRPPHSVDEIVRSGEVRPWMVRSAAVALAVLAAIGLAMGARQPASGVTLPLTSGVALAPGAVASAAQAAPLPKDPMWSMLSGPLIRTSAGTGSPPTATDSDAGAASAEPDAAANAADEADQPDDTPAPPPQPSLSSGEAAPVPANAPPD